MNNSTHLLLAGKPAAEQIQAESTQRRELLPHTPRLVIILVGENPSSLAYINRKLKLATKLGVQAELRQFNNSITTEKLLSEIAAINSDTNINGLIVQLPLPDHIETQNVIDAVKPQKDVDGLSATSLGHLMAGYPQLVPATALGVIKLLQFYKIPIVGQRALVIGRSRLVGQPLAQLLLQNGATVTIAHRQTQYLASLTQEADILVSAAGQPDLVVPDMVKQGATVIDIGLTPTEDGLRGDVAAGVSEIAGAITPVPGGVGPLTVACLIQNLIQAAEQQMTKTE